MNNNFSYKIPSNAIFIAYILLLCIGLMWLQTSTGVVTDTGDGIMHFLISKFSWNYPRLFMDHWGKPIFTLLSSPFSQFGYTGMVLFNVLCFAGTSFIAGKIIGKHPICYLFPALLLSSPIYIDLSVSGMTEPLFGLLTIWNIYLLLREKHVPAAVLASFLIYARPEAVCFVPFFGLYTLYKRQFRAIPFYLTGTVLYMLAGMLVYKDALWFIHENPYQGAHTSYGSGSYWHFIVNSHFTFGKLLMVLFPFCMLAIAIPKISKKLSQSRIKLTLLMALPGLAVIAMHSVFWGMGIAGSLGLLRVVAIGLPALILFTLVVFRDIPTRKSIKLVLTFAIIIVAPILSWPEIKAYSPLFREPTIQQQLQEETAAFIIEEKLMENATIVSVQTPYISFLLDIDIFGDEEFLVKGYLDEKHPTLGLPAGSLFVWDGQFGPVEMNTPLEMVMNNPHFKLMKSFIPEKRAETVGGRNYEIHIFTISNDSISYEKERNVLINLPEIQKLSDEFPLTFVNTIQHDTSYIFKTINMECKMLSGVENAKSFRFIYSELLHDGTAEFYWEFVAQPDGDGIFKASFRMPPRQQPKDTRVYFWNPELHEYSISDLKIEEEITRSE